MYHCHASFWAECYVQHVPPRGYVAIRVLHRTTYEADYMLKLLCPHLQVALVSGLDSDGLKKLNSSSEGSQHINKLLRVLTVRTEAGKEKSGIMLVGGPHDPKVDGSATQRYTPSPLLVGAAVVCIHDTVQLGTVTSR